MNTKTNNEWEKRLEDKFGSLLFTGSEHGFARMAELKDFIRNLLSSERQRLIDLIKDREFEVVEKRTGALHEMYEAGYQSALSDILKLIEE